MGVNFCEENVKLYTIPLQYCHIDQYLLVESRTEMLTVHFELLCKHR